MQNMMVKLANTKALTSAKLTEPGIVRVVRLCQP